MSPKSQKIVALSSQDREAKKKSSKWTLLSTGDSTGLSHTRMCIRGCWQFQRRQRERCMVSG